jgi:hypothetical protein
MKIKLSILMLSMILLTSCAKIYYSPDAQILSKNHKIIAILPPTVSIAASRKTDAEAIKEQQKTESLNFQKEMYSWLLRRKMQGNVLPEILDIETTNAKLKKAGFPETPYTPSEMCKILEVDGLLGSNYALSKPMSDGAAVALYLLAGAAGSTNQVRVSLNISDCKDKKLIWNYDHKLEGSIGSKPSSLVNQLMRQASRKMPYMIK